MVALIEKIQKMLPRSGVSDGDLYRLMHDLHIRLSAGGLSGGAVPVAHVVPLSGGGGDDEVSSDDEPLPPPAPTGFMALMPHPAGGPPPTSLVPFAGRETFGGRATTPPPVCDDNEFCVSPVRLFIGVQEE